MGTGGAGGTRLGARRGGHDVTLIGELALWIALLMAAWTAGVSCAGGVWRRPAFVVSGERAMDVTCACTIVASAGLVSALVTGDLAVRYVATYIDASVPAPYAIAALWAGTPGSLLFCAMVLSAAAALAQVVDRPVNRELRPWVTATISVVVVVLLAATLDVNPYTRLDRVPLDGRGMNPLLQSAAMALYPPVLYAGYTASTVALAYAIAARIARRPAGEAADAVRRWTVVAWLAITAGIALVLWATYADLGRAAVWAWGPVETTSLLAWLSATALLHGVGGAAPRRVAARWSGLLVVTTFLLSIAGADRLRNRVAASVEPFAPVPGGIWIVGVLAAALVAALAYGGIRRRRPGALVVYAGMAIVVLAGVGMAFRMQADATLAPGAAYSIRDPFGHRWTFTNAGVSRFERRDQQVIAVALTTTRDGKPRGLITAEWREHFDRSGRSSFDPAPRAGIVHGVAEDVYVALVGFRADGEQARVLIAFNPAVSGIWYGALTMLIGGLFAWWPAALAAPAANGARVILTDVANGSSA
jgi:cytochrome c biogenesis factor